MHLTTRSRFLALALVIVGSGLCSPAMTAEQSVPQLYIFADPDPKRGYIEAGEASGQMVKFRECDANSFILVDRERLKPEEGDCRKHSPGHGGTWVYSFDRTSGGNVVLKEVTTGTVSTYTEGEWDKKTSTEDTKPMKGDYIGVTKTKTGEKESVFVIKPSK